MKFLIKKISVIKKNYNSYLKMYINKRIIESQRIFCLNSTNQNAVFISENTTTFDGFLQWYVKFNSLYVT